MLSAPTKEGFRRVPAVKPQHKVPTEEAAIADRLSIEHTTLVAEWLLVGVAKTTYGEVMFCLEPANVCAGVKLGAEVHVDRAAQRPEIIIYGPPRYCKASLVEKKKLRQCLRPLMEPGAPGGVR